MTIIRHCLCLTALLGLLAGCASAPPDTNTLFLLQQDQVASTATATTPPAADNTAPVLALTPVQLAPYLAGDGIVYQTGPNRIVVAASNQWAAPLQSQLTDGLYQTLDAALTRMDIRRPGLMPAGADKQFGLVVHIQQFQGRYDGQAIISGDWRLLGHGGEDMARGAFNKTTPLQNDGYAALVRALSDGWMAVRQAIAAGVDQALAASAQAGS